MPTKPAVPTSNITTTEWGINGTGAIYAILAANSGTTNSGQMSGGSSSNALVLGTGFSIAGMTAVTAVAYSVSWTDTGKEQNTDFTLTLVESGGSTPLATAANVVTGSSTEITSNGSFTIQAAGHTLANWLNFDIQLQCGVSTGANVDGQFYGLSLTVTYSTGQTQTVNPVAALWLGSMS